MKDFKKTLGAALAFALIYTFCMYENDASITFPILMAVGIWLLYAISPNRKIFDNKLSGFYTISIMLISVTVFLTGDWKLIFMSKMAAYILYLCLAIELYYDDSMWIETQYIKKILKMSFGSLCGIGDIFTDYAKYREEHKTEESHEKIQNQNLKKVMKGILVTIPLLLIIVPLMMSADIVFSQMMESVLNFEGIIDFLFNELNIVSLVFVFGCALVLYYGLLKILQNAEKTESVVLKNYSDKITGITVTGIISFVYTLFSLIQVRGIFFSNVKLPEGYTYAEYAREGFFQLFILAVINMIIVLVCASKYEYSKIMNIILYILCGCTYIMIFSSGWKMLLYIKEYNLTFLRLMELWALVVLTLIMAAVIKYIHENDFSLFKYITIVTTCFYIIIAFAKPDYIIAKYNLEYGNQMEVDRGYLNYLSSDAAPIIIKHKEKLNFELDDYYFSEIKRSYDKMNFIKFNLSRYIAKSYIEKSEY